MRHAPVLVVLSIHSRHRHRKPHPAMHLHSRHSWPQVTLPLLQLAGRTHLVRHLEACVVAQNVERCAVALPQELQPRRDEGAVRAVAVLLARHGAEQHGLGRLALLEVLDVGLLGRGGLVGLLLRVGDAGLADLDEVADDDVDAGGVGVLRDVLVLQQAVLDEAAAAHVDAEVGEAQHDGLEGGERRLLEGAQREDLAQRRQCGRLLPDAEQLLGALEQRLGTLEARHAGQGSRAGGAGWVEEERGEAAVCKAKGWCREGGAEGVGRQQPASSHRPEGCDALALAERRGGSVARAQGTAAKLSAPRATAAPPKIGSLLPRCST
jgi:hypothetical protein